MADRGIRQAVDSVRSHAPSPPPHRLASQANPSSSSQPSGSSHQLPSSSNRGPSTMPSTFGRPVQAFAAPSSRPLPPSNPRQGTLGHAAQRPAADAQRYPAQAMPAWMQKAKQAGVQAKVSGLHEHDVPFARSKCWQQGRVMRSLLASGVLPDTAVQHLCSRHLRQSKR